MDTKYATQSRKYRSTKRGHIATLLSRARRRAGAEGLPFDINIEYLMELPSDKCPVFGMSLAWCAGNKYRQEDAPSLDKINPALGYIKGNVAWISWRANRIKNDGSAQDHYRIAEWMMGRDLPA